MRILRVERTGKIKTIMNSNLYGARISHSLLQAWIAKPQDAFDGRYPE